MANYDDHREADLIGELNALMAENINSYFDKLKEISHVCYHEQFDSLREEFLKEYLVA